MANEHHSLATYVSDMLALERHIRIPFDTQRNDHDFKEFNDSYQLVTRLSALSDTHIDGLKAMLDALGGQEASPIKSAVSEIEGAVAGAIDKVRKTKVSKALRDDYTALSLCSVSYSALLSTANALGNSEVAALAQRFLQDYAQSVMDIGEAMPSIVVQELRAIDLDVDSSTVEASRQQVTAAWLASRQGRDETTTSRGTVGSTPLRTDVDVPL